MATEKKKKHNLEWENHRWKPQHANSKGSPSLPFAVHFLGDEVPHSGNSAYFASETEVDSLPWVANMATKFIAFGPYSKDIGKPTVLSFYLLKNNGLLVVYLWFTYLSTYYNVLSISMSHDVWPLGIFNTAERRLALQIHCFHLPGRLGRLGRLGLEVNTGGWKNTKPPNDPNVQNTIKWMP